MATKKAATVEAKKSCTAGLEQQVAEFKKQQEHAAQVAYENAKDVRDALAEAKSSNNYIVIALCVVAALEVVILIKIYGGCGL